MMKSLLPKLHGILFFHIAPSEWKFLNSWVFNLTNDTYLRWFQTRILHRILATNTLLKKMNIVSDEKCSMCKKENERRHYML